MYLEFLETISMNKSLQHKKIYNNDAFEYPWIQFTFEEMKEIDTPMMALLLVNEWD